MKERLTTYEGPGIRALREQVRGRVILFGNATYGIASDVFCVPGFEEPVPGVFLHACGVATLAGRPLYELSALARMGLDGVLSVAVVGGVTWLCGFYRRRGTPNEPFLLASVTVVAVVVTVVLGFVLVGITRVLWTDFVLVAAALFLHSLAGRMMRKVNKLRERLGTWWDENAREEKGHA